MTRPDIADAVIHARLEDGTRICIRAVRPADEQRMRDGIAALSAESRYFRFFSAQPMPSDAVVRSLVDADGNRHLAWGAIAIAQPGEPAIGAVHAVRARDRDDAAEFSVGIVDAYHGIGLARMLVAVLLTHCRLRGILTLDVQTLSDNDAARGLIGLLCGDRTGADMGITDYRLDTGHALNCLAAAADSDEFCAVLATLAEFG